MSTGFEISDEAAMLQSKMSEQKADDLQISNCVNRKNLGYEKLLDSLNCYNLLPIGIFISI